MHILFVVPYAPTLIRTRPYNLLRSLARQGHELTLATVWENQADQHSVQALTGLAIAALARPLTKLRALGKTVRGFASSTPLQAHWSWQPALARAVADAIIRTLVEARGATIEFLPPYSPDFNPIELCWATVKVELRKAKARPFDQLLDALRAALLAVTPEHALALFAHCGYAPA